MTASGLPKPESLALDDANGEGREGDPPALMADARRIRQTLAWEPQYADLDQIVRHALAWEQKTALQTA
ncbi:hypothetical protein [Thioalkalivibrio sp. ALE9]|uniref:hypothetical protein n=1 Tax=Thioalkalivibrio sp. ALE9 TaxID=1158169 RepID=UPI00037DC8BE|nr:hypothetical protein [Thioalkalivibrio sp. ALE9]